MATFGRRGVVTNEETMRKAYLSIRAVLSAGVATLVSWLGLSGCDRSTMNNGMCMYGTPTVEYQFKVKVTDQTGKPVEGLQVGILQDSDRELTGKDGVATIEGQYTGFYEDHEVNLLVKDIDGDTNGIVTELNKSERITKADFVKKGNGAWNNGTVKKEINLKVERK